MIPELPGEPKQNHWKWLFFILAIFLFLLLALFLAFISAQRYYADKFYPHISIDGQPVGGMTINQAASLFNEKVDRISQNGVPFAYEGTKATIMPVISSVEGDLAYEVIRIEADKALNEAGSYGHTADSWQSAKQFYQALIAGRNFDVIVTVNDAEIKKNLIENFSKYDQPAENASLAFVKGQAGQVSFSVQAEKNGRTLDFDRAINELKENLAHLDNKEIGLKSIDDQPAIIAANTSEAPKKAEALLASAPLELKYKDESWTVSKDSLAAWLSIKINPRDNNIIVGLNDVLVKDYLEKKIGAKINKEPIDARFEMKDGKIVEFQTSQDGMKINTEESIAAIETAILANATSTIELIVEEYKSSIKTESVNDLGIKEIIGTGQSNFKGSPKNRRHNIKNGANKVNGVLIKPDEEFSLIKTLGAIDATTGYLPELVIKENKTTPEYGGGLCQIGTTVFRGALASGLPITMRRNHSYRVSYYEPAGTDATIYDPLPDLRFKNDTGNYILIQARIEGDLLYFDFWGTKDGRKVEQAKPTIYNIVKPQPTKIVETLELKPGEKKCTETSHNGADAYFDYKVTYPDGTVKEKRFSSHYVPWRAVCLLGVKELSTNKTTTATASSTLNNNANAAN